MTHGSGSAWRLTRWLPSLPTHPCWRAGKKDEKGKKHLGSRFTAARLRCRGEFTLARRKFCELWTTIEGGQLLWPRWLVHMRSMQFLAVWVYRIHFLSKRDWTFFSLTSNLTMYFGQLSPKRFVPLANSALICNIWSLFWAATLCAYSSGGTEICFFLCVQLFMAEINLVIKTLNNTMCVFSLRYVYRPLCLEYLFFGCKVSGLADLCFFPCGVVNHCCTGEKNGFQF